MKKLRYELQNLIYGNGQESSACPIKKTQNFLRGYAETSRRTQNTKYSKTEEEVGLRNFILSENLLYTEEISENDFISAGAEQRVYRYDEYHIIKTNDSVFYEFWLDYFNSLLIHNYFFKATAYQFLGFIEQSEKLFAVVKQEFIVSTSITDLTHVKSFLEFNGFLNKRNNDYYSNDLSLIFEDLHDENVLTKSGILYFIDTVFYLMKNFSDDYKY